jgi:magnesium-transporting ATPase (P-type)
MSISSDDPVPLSQIDVSSPVKQVLLTCHALANLEGDIIGDPLEKATLNALDWTVTRGDTVVPNKGRAGRWQIFQRYHFLSALKRMSVIAGQGASPSSNETTYIVAVKGAPETLKPMVRRFVFFLFRSKQTHQHRKSQPTRHSILTSSISTRSFKAKSVLLTYRS